MSLILRFFRLYYARFSYFLLAYCVASHLQKVPSRLLSFHLCMWHQSHISTCLGTMALTSSIIPKISTLYGSNRAYLFSFSNTRSNFTKFECEIQRILLSCKCSLFISTPISVTNQYLLLKDRLVCTQANQVIGCFYCGVLCSKSSNTCTFPSFPSASAFVIISKI